MHLKPVSFSDTGMNKDFRILLPWCDYYFTVYCCMYSDSDVRAEQKLSYNTDGTSDSGTCMHYLIKCTFYILYIHIR